MCVSAGAFRGFTSPGAEATGSHELPEVSAGRTWSTARIVHTLSHLPSPVVAFETGSLSYILRLGVHLRLNLINILSFQYPILCAGITSLIHVLML